MLRDLIPSLRLCTMPVFSSAQCEQGPHIMHILQPLQQRHQMHQVIVCGITDPSLNRYGVV